MLLDETNQLSAIWPRLCDHLINVYRLPFLIGYLIANAP